LLNVERVVAVNDDVGPQLAEIVDEVVGKAVVIIDEQDHDWLGEGGFSG
jgi:hypothetical protein